MEGKIKALVFQFLTEVDPKAAAVFKKNVKPKGLDSGAAGLKEIVSFYDKNSPKKAVRLDEVGPTWLEWCLSLEPS